jgi:hypothetical protein
MLSVAPLALSDESGFDLFIAAKQDPTRGYLLTARPAVLAAYQAYAAAAPEVGHLGSAQLSSEEGDALRHAYESSTKPLEELRTALLDRVEVARCPFCGISESSTLDHYLPKEDHPVYAVYSQHLVPSCCLCNNRKRQLVLDQATQVRLFLHPYFDHVPNEQFLHLTVGVSVTTINLTYHIGQPASMSPALHAQLISHFRLLNLADRYRLRSLGDLRGMGKSLLRLYGSPGKPDRVRQRLLEEADSIASEFGVNHWRAVLHAGLAESDEFCDGGFKAIVRTA